MDVVVPVWEVEETGTEDEVVVTAVSDDWDVDG